MTVPAYTEDQLVEQPAIRLFAELGRTTVSAEEEFVGRSRGDETHSTTAESQSLVTSSPTVRLERETNGEVVLASRLRAASERLNPARPPEATTVSGLIEWLTASRCKSLMSKWFLFE